MAKGNMLVNWTQKPNVLRHSERPPFGGHEESRLNILNWLLPEPCALCGRLNQSLCDNCYKAVASRVRFGICGACGRITKGRCRFCLKRLGAIKQAVALGSYEDERLEKLIQAFKFRGLASLAEPLGEMLADLLRRELPVKPDALVPIPISRPRLRERGYNQAELLAKAIGQSCGLPVCPILHRQPGEHQVGKTRAEREALSQEAFFLKGRLPDNGRIVLVDDVITTGATLRTAANLLKSAGYTPIAAALIAFEP